MPSHLADDLGAVHGGKIIWWEYQASVWLKF